ncbi:MAG TPA: hypothetical protein VF690_15920 [Hymenobacter sp.]
MLGLVCMQGSMLATPAADNHSGTWLLDDGHYQMQVLPQARAGGTPKLWPWARVWPLKT